MNTNKKWLLIGVIATMLIFSFSLYNSSQNEKIEKERIEKQELEKKYQDELKAQQELLLKKDAEIKKKQKEEAERVKKEEISSIISQLNELYMGLNKAKSRLNSVTGFKLLRTSSERNQEINAAQNQIDIIQAKINKLEGRLKELDPNFGADT